MGIEKDIEAIRDGIKVGRFTNEASVSQGIVLRVLSALGWSTYDTDAVWPEYSLENRRVDFALCSPPSKPIAFIEVKQIGQSDGAERQLFEYAFHRGVPMTILTDGREWNFFLPGEQGDYRERRVYKLDIVERDTKECIERFERYLLHSAVVSGAAIKAARADYGHVSKNRQMLATLPKAWSQLIANEDEMLLEIVGDRVESLCGFKPTPDMVAQFLKESVLNRMIQPIQQRQTPMPTGHPAPLMAITKVLEPPLRMQQVMTPGIDRTGFMFEGSFHPAQNAIDVLKQVFDVLIQRDVSFAERFVGLPKHGRSRRYLARDAYALYPSQSPEFAKEHSWRCAPGWYLGTNHSNSSITKIIEMACDVARVELGKDLLIQLD
jgi:hypothetical protein